MDSTKTERPKLIIFEAFTSPYKLISSVLVVVFGFYFSDRQVTLASVIIAIIIFLAIVFGIGLFHYFVRYVAYLLATARNHDRLMQLYGAMKSQLVEKERIISSYPPELLSNFGAGVIRGLRAAFNEDQSDLKDKDISVLEKEVGSDGVELIFDVGSEAGISEGMLLSIVTTYGNELWGVVQIISVDENRCRGAVLSRINTAFWKRMEDDMYHDPSPPSQVKARLYLEKDISAEMTLKSEIIGKSG